MTPSAELHLAYKFGNAPINLFPYPHLYLQDIFPPDFYRDLQANLPDPSLMLPIEQVRPVKGYKERFVLELKTESLATLEGPKHAFWKDVHSWLVEGRFGKLVLEKFGPFSEERFAGKDPAKLEFYQEAYLVQDITNYSLGPHTDAARKVVTLLFYLPENESQLHMGTSIYIPKNPHARCPGGPHYKHDLFDLMYTMPFAPNSLFAFFKTDNSFHGVEPVNEPNCKRWLLLYDIYVREK